MCLNWHISCVIQTLGELCELVDAEKTSVDTSKGGQHKADIEDRAGKELRDASMTGLVRRNRLVDVASLEGASVRERQGQRKYVSPLPNMTRCCHADLLRGVHDPMTTKRTAVSARTMQINGARRHTILSVTSLTSVSRAID